MRRAAGQALATLLILLVAFALLALSAMATALAGLAAAGQETEAALAQARARLGLPPQGTDDRVDPAETAIVRQARALDFVEDGTVRFDVDPL